MKMLCFGTCAGTEPIKGRKHVSFALEIKNQFYWFDAGEGCSYTASMMGVDLLKVKAIFISHAHMDHVGGLGNLLWNIRKNSIVRKLLPTSECVNLFVPNRKSWEGIYTILKETEGNFKLDYRLKVNDIKDGILYKDENIEVESYHNFHIMDEMPWLSYSFKISAEGKVVVYSGDVHDYHDLDYLLKDGCDILIIETGHFNSKDVVNYVKTSGFSINEVYFIHCGNDVLIDKNRVEEYLKRTKINAKILEDEQIIEI